DGTTARTACAVTPHLYGPPVANGQFVAVSQRSLKARLCYDPTTQDLSGRALETRQKLRPRDEPSLGRTIQAWKRCEKTRGTYSLAQGYPRIPSCSKVGGLRLYPLIKYNNSISHKVTPCGCGGW